MILYLPQVKGPGKELYQTVKKASANRELERYRSVQELSERLHRPIFDVQVAVLWAGDRSELDELVSLGDFLTGMRIILVLPDREATTIAQAHLLRPRFIAWLDEDLSCVETFLRKLLILSDEPVRPPVRKIIRTPLAKSSTIATKKT